MILTQDNSQRSEHRQKLIAETPSDAPLPAPNFQGFILMKNALNTQVGMLGDMFLWLVANLKQGVIYFIKQACGNDILASV